MWVEQDAQIHYQAENGAILAEVAPIAGQDWQWKVGISHHGRIEWTLIGANPTRESAIDSAKAMVSQMELALESGSNESCGW